MALDKFYTFSFFKVGCQENMNRIKIKSLHYYPVKACAGLSVENAELTPRGILNDRLYMFVDQDGYFLTQRDIPKMALIEPQVEKTGLLLKAPSMEPVTISKIENDSPLIVNVWDDYYPAIDQGDEAAQWISSYLGINSRLVLMNKNFARRVDSKYALSETDQVSFADGYPFLLISQESLDDLNCRLENPLPMNRFRPNIVIEGCEPYQEDKMKRIKVGDVIFDVVKPCIRCVVTTIDQKTLKKSKEPLATLAAYRKSASGGVQFGQNLIHHSTGIISVDDTVEIIKSV